MTEYALSGEAMTGRRPIQHLPVASATGYGYQRTQPRGRNIVAHSVALRATCCCDWFRWLTPPASFMSASGLWDTVTKEHSPEGETLSHIVSPSGLLAAATGSGG